MKSTTIKLIIWSLIAVMILGLAVVMFARPNFFSNINFRIPFASWIRYANAERYSTGDGSVEGTVTSLEINWLDGNITILPYDGETVELEEEASDKLDPTDMLHWYNDNGCLKIQYMASGSIPNRVLWKELTVRVPRGTSLDRVKVDTVSSALSLSDIDVTAVDIDTVSGNSTLSGVNGDTLKCESVSGSLYGMNIGFRNINNDTVSGTVKLAIKTGTELREINCESVSGEITLGLPENTGFTATLNTVSGEIVHDFAVKMSGKKLICGDGAVSIDGNTVSGNMYMEKSQY